MFWKKDCAEQMGVISKELEFLVKNIMRSPKSYTLWFHRWWIIEWGLRVEREMGALGSSKVLDMELKLCDKMLS